MKKHFLIFILSLFTHFSFSQLMATQEDARIKMSRNNYKWEDSHLENDGNTYEGYTYTKEDELPLYVTLIYWQDKRCHCVTYQDGHYHKLKGLMKDLAGIFDLQEIEENMYGNFRTDVYVILKPVENNGWSLNLIQK